MPFLQLKRPGDPVEELKAAYKELCTPIGNMDPQGRQKILERQLRWQLASSPEAIGKLLADLAELEGILPDAASLLDSVKQEWAPQGTWSEWDQSVRDRIANYNLRRLKERTQP